MSLLSTEKWKQLLSAGFIENAHKHNRQPQDIKICFMLINMREYRSICEGKEIDLVPAMYFMFKGKVHRFISAALIRFAQQDNIELKNVNVVMSMNENNVLQLHLANAYTTIREITAEELLN